ncbi:MAG: choice-of-anchor J domain-containing protein [candidate division WOR-3 bacterium]
MRYSGSLILLLSFSLLLGQTLTVEKISPSELLKIPTINVNLSNTERLYGIIDTIRNHDNFNTPSAYIPGCSLYAATRLTMPLRAVDQCTLWKVIYYVRIPNPTNNGICRFYIWRDTIINGIRQPGDPIMNQQYTFNVPEGGIYRLYFILSSTSQYILNRGESFWIGMINLNRNTQIIVDGSENPDTTRNAYKFFDGNWQSLSHDFIFEAVVKYEPRDNNIGVVSILTDKILKVNTVSEINAVVQNFGRNTLTSGIPVIRKITGPNYYEQIDTAYTSEALSQNQTLEVEFSDWQVPINSGDYLITIWTAFDQDSLNGNDTLATEVFVYSHGYRESFTDEIFPHAGWTVLNLNNHNTWRRDTFSFGYYTPPAGVMVLYDQAPYWPNNDWLVTPRLSATPQDSIIFWYRAGTSLFTETLLIRINFNPAASIDTGGFQIIEQLVTNDYRWQKCVIPLSSYLTMPDTIMIAFHYPDFNNFYIALDDIIIPEPIRHIDFLVEKLVSPKLPILADSTYIPRARVRNNSIEPESSCHTIKVFCQITGNVVEYLDSIIEGVEPGNFSDYNFSSFTPQVPDTVEIKIWCADSRDENPYNDTLRKIVYIAPKFQNMPYYTNFNENWGKYGDNPPYGGWRIIDCGSEYYKEWNTNDWYRDTIRAGNILRTVAKVYYSPIENQVESLISPQLNCSIPGIYTLSYWHWYRDWSPLTIDSGVVLISNNNGQSWHRIVRYTNTSDSGYKIHDISQYASGSPNVRICFLYKARDEWYWCLDDFSVSFILYPPQLISPRHNLETLATQVEFQWRTVPGASRYVFQIAYDSLFGYLFCSETITDTSVTKELPATRYFWRVRAGEPYSNWSEIRSLTIQEPMVLMGWYELKSIPILGGGKPVKDGARMVFSSVDTSIYAIKGNNTVEFYRYKILSDTWIKRKDVAMDSLKARKIRKGSALAYGNLHIYLIKGGTKEFWTYDIINDSWIRKKDFPSQLKAGTDIVYVSGSIKTDNNKIQEDYIYLLKGSDKNFEFWAYSISNDSWIRKSDAPRGPDNKQFKDGSCLVYDANNYRIYALKAQAKVNEFYYYDISGDSWSAYNFLPDLPLRAPYSSKNTKVKNGALAIIDTIIYAIKGGGSTEFWSFNINQGRWVILESIPRKNSSKQSVPKAGASLVAGLGNIYLLKGNNTQEFWIYYPYAHYKVNDPIQLQLITTVQTEHITKLDNTMLAIRSNIVNNKLTITYSLSNPSAVTLVLYDISGRVVKQIKNSMPANSSNDFIEMDANDIPAGVYFINLTTSSGENFRAKLIKR